VLPAAACSLPDRRPAAQGKTFETEGGFNKRRYRVRCEERSLRPASNRSTKSLPITKN
jgi:hypothetical protein